MTELALRQDNPPAQYTAPATLVEWGHAARAAHALASSLASTSFCPDAFRGRAEEATAAILAGSEVGLSPMAALNAFDVIQGRPAPKAITLRAIVQSRGHRVWQVKATDTECVMRGQRRGDDTTQEVRWTADRARRLKLTGKPNWQNQPQAMLIARATSEICRLIAADAILGIPHSSEELADQEPAGTATLSRADTPAPKRVARRKPEPAPEPVIEEPPLDDAEIVEEAIPDTVEPITDAQMKKLHILFKEAGLDRDAALAYCYDTLEREITSTKELTKADASTVIDALTNQTAEETTYEPDGES